MNRPVPDRGEPPPARVLIVDDSAEIRMLLRLTFGQDDRFAVVGEAANGREAVDRVAALEPDIVILDRQMPVLGGLEALPELRRRAPRAAVLLYTAGATAGTAAEAIASGAVGVVEKTTVGAALTEEIAHRLIEHWSGPAADVEVRVGPVSSEAARAWVDNTSCIVAALRDNPGVLDPPVPPDVLDLFDRFLAGWGDVATGTERFQWVGRAAPDDVRRIVEHWAAIDSMSDAQLAALGCRWSPPEAKPFFAALTQGVLDALAHHDTTRHLADRLARKWAPTGPT